MRHQNTRKTSRNHLSCLSVDQHYRGEQFQMAQIRSHSRDEVHKHGGNFVATNASRQTTLLYEIVTAKEIRRFGFTGFESREQATTRNGDIESIVCRKFIRCEQ